MMIAGILSFLMTAIFSFQVMRVPISVRQLPWNSNGSRLLLAREAFKVLLILQDYAIQVLDVSSHQVFISLYYVFLLAYLITITVMKGKPSYFDPVVERATLLSQGITICFGLASTFRACFDVNIAEIAFFTPLIGYSTIHFLKMLEQSRTRGSIMKFVETKRGASDDSFRAVQYLALLMDKIRSDPILGMAESYSNGSQNATLNLTLAPEDAILT